MDYRELLKSYMRLVLETEGVTFVDYGPFSDTVSDTDTAELLKIEAEIRAGGPAAGDPWPCDCGEVADHKLGCPRRTR